MSNQNILRGNVVSSFPLFRTICLYTHTHSHTLPTV